MSVRPRDRRNLDLRDGPAAIPERGARLPPVAMPVHPMFEQPWPEGEYRLFQLGFVVDDLLADAARWAHVLGVGPFHVTPTRTSSATYRGAPSNVEVQYALAQAGPVQIELIQQHCDRPSMFRDVFAQGRVGVPPALHRELGLRRQGRAVRADSATSSPARSPARSARRVLRHVRRLRLLPRGRRAQPRTGGTMGSRRAHLCRVGRAGSRPPDHRRRLHDTVEPAPRPIGAESGSSRASLMPSCPAWSARRWSPTWSNRRSTTSR